MSIPQNRERVFFIALRKDLSKHFENKKDFFNLSPYLNLEFNDNTTNYIEIEQPFDETITKYISNNSLKHWKKLKPGQAFSKVHPKGAMFNQKKINPNKPLPTITASNDKLYHYAIPRKLYATEYQLASSFPLDYNFLNNQAVYVCGMSVPPVMMANISKKIYEQWLTKISNETNNYIRTKSQSN
jgi:DNA (cytosine-5)-methyltransferase 1